MLRITGRGFCAGIERGGLCAPILGYMKGWTLKRIMSYCHFKGWTVEQIGD